MDILTPDGMAEATSIKVEDILSTLQHLKMIKQLKGQFVLHISMPNVQELLDGFEERKFGRAFCNPKLLTF